MAKRKRTNNDVQNNVLTLHRNLRKRDTPPLNPPLGTCKYRCTSSSTTPLPFVIDPSVFLLRLFSSTLQLSWWLAVLMGETGILFKNHRPVKNHPQNLSKEMVN